LLYQSTHRKKHLQATEEKKETEEYQDVMEK